MKQAECLQNITALITFGANPNVPNSKTEVRESATPLELAREPDARRHIGPAIIRMMEDAARPWNLDMTP